MAELPKRTATYGSAFPLTRAGRLQSWRIRRRMERHEREVAEAVRQRPFPFYGLPESWECRRALRGSSYGKATGLGSVRLGHWSGDGAGAIGIHVNTSRGGRGALEEAKEDVEYDLGLRDHDDEQTGELEWRQMRVSVDGTATDFEVIAGRDREWGAVGAVGNVVVAVEIRNFAMADVVLETIIDVEPYIAGQQERSRAPLRKQG